MECAFAACAAMVVVAPSTLMAHQGPPYPILMDQPAVGHRVSVWADPDVGDAVFFIVVETTEGTKPAESLEVAMWYEPVSGRLERVSCLAKRESLRHQLQFKAVPHFDQPDRWKIGFEIETVEGDVGELRSEIESTPPGDGVRDFLVYFFPFLILGGAWVVVIARRIRRAPARRSSRSSARASPTRPGAEVSRCWGCG